jgi:hypothetical protein
MNSRYLKQVAYNYRIIEAEKKVAAINCELPLFLAEMSLDPAEQVYICVNGSEEMKRGEEQIGGQLWIQGERRITAHNHICEGLANTKESAILSAAVEAVTWTHALEDDIDGPRKGQRVIIYPKEMTNLEQVLETSDLSIDTEDGHTAADIAILQARQCFETPPVFLKADHPLITSDPQVSQSVPRWMNTAARVATRCRQNVLEDGPDVMHSDDEDAIEQFRVRAAGSSQESSTRASRA